MNSPNPLNYEQEIPDILKSMAQVHGAMDRHGFDRTIHHLVLLRASQINRCGFCVEMHTREAREDGERRVVVEAVGLVQVGHVVAGVAEGRHLHVAVHPEGLAYRDGDVRLVVLQLGAAVRLC